MKLQLREGPSARAQTQKKIQIKPIEKPILKRSNEKYRNYEIGLIRFRYLHLPPSIAIFFPSSLSHQAVNAYFAILFFILLLFLFLLLIRFGEPFLRRFFFHLVVFGLFIPVSIRFVLLLLLLLLLLTFYLRFFIQSDEILINKLMQMKI